MSDGHASENKRVTRSDKTRKKTLFILRHLSSDIRPLDLRWPGGYGEGPAPDPFPNSAVKTLSANGTAS